MKPSPILVFSSRVDSDNATGYSSFVVDFFLEMLKVVWILVPPTVPTKTLIVVLMVVIVCRLIVGIINI